MGGVEFDLVQGFLDDRLDGGDVCKPLGSGSDDDGLLGLPVVRVAMLDGLFGE